MSSQEILSQIGNTSDETEFYTPLPPGYRKGHTQYVIVFGTVMSGLGKGIFSSSLAKRLQDMGLRVAPIKLEGYLNIDSGTLNPFRHGEVFVLDDGMETDMDLGTYERMLDQDLTRDNFTTSGQIFTRVLEKERQGNYLGRDVQMIPHVTGEVKFKLRELAVKTKADVLFVEVGGTVGDYENAFLIEAMRELAYEEGTGSTVFVALTYIMTPPTLGEQKSKAAQLGIKRLMEMGIQPHIIACRAADPVNEKVRQKISVFTNVPIERVFSMHDCDSIYLIPDMIRGAGIDQQVVKMLNIEPRTDANTERKHHNAWSGFVKRIRAGGPEVTIGITGKYTAVRDSYASILKALEHCGCAAGCHVSVKWIDTSDMDHKAAAKELADVSGMIVPGGFGVRGATGKINCIQYARENAVPYLGICYGFQLAVVEFAQNVCGIRGANSSEIEPGCRDAVIDILPEQKELEGLGGNMRLGGKDVAIRPETLAWRLFGNKERVRLRFRHRYEVDPKYIEKLESAGMIFSGKAPDYPIMQILELLDHPYFIGTQAHPELTSRPLRPSPMFMGLVQVAMERAQVKPDPPIVGEMVAS